VIFGSPRQGLAYLYAHHRGPSLARPRYHDAPGETGRSHLDGPLVGALLYGPVEPEEAGAMPGCGVVQGGELDLELRRWATTAGQGTERSDAIRRVERRLRDLFREHGLMRARYRAPAVHHWVDPDGVSWGSLGPSSTTCAALA
jgi:hypothetical protein